MVAWIRRRSEADSYETLAQCLGFLDTLSFHLAVLYRIFGADLLALRS